MREAPALLAQAAHVYDADASLAAAARTAAAAGFVGGAEWMRAALGRVRRAGAPDGVAAFGRLGATKYAVCAAAAAVPVVAGALTANPWWLLASVPAFYVAEAQTVFLFPAALDGAPRPFAAARTLTVRAGGTWTVVSVVLPIAATMVLGGLFGRGFVRSWCVGCLAVLLWYERVKGDAETSEFAPA